MLYWGKQYYISDSPIVTFKFTNNQWKSDGGLTWSYGKTNTIKDFPSVLGSMPRKWMSKDEFFSQKSHKIGWASNSILSYTNPIIACLLARVHDPSIIDSSDLLLWECTGKVDKVTIDKVALCSELKTERPREIYPISVKTRLQFGFGCVDKVYKDNEYQQWVNDWFSGRDRTPDRARSMTEKCYEAVRREERKSGTMSLTARAAHAAQWMSQAVLNQASEKLTELWVAQAVVEANRAAYEDGKPFDILEIAESVMSAR